MKVLVTGGAGYIGSTICSALLDNGYEPVILDSLVTGKREFTKNKIFYEGDISDINILNKIFQDNPDIKYTIHCAALIVVPESVSNPFDYYYENVAKSLILFKTLNNLGCNRIVFSSSASIYDDSKGFLVTEDPPLNPRSPYARTKYMIEMILQDFCNAYDMHAIALRYFNPIGADPKMRSGIHVQFPSHILGKLVEANSLSDGVFKITGTNWNTRDGSGIRDYLHVWDLANAHVKAIKRFDYIFTESDFKVSHYVVINIGNGKGVTVKELVSAFEKVIGKELNKTYAPPRPGDIPGAYASVERAKKLLNWKAEMSIEEGIKSALKWEEFKKMVLKIRKL